MHAVTEARCVAPGVAFAARGYATLSGPALRLYRRIERALDAWVAGFSAEDHLAPPFIPAATLDRAGYFQAFPHHTTFPVALASASESLQRFADAPFTADGALDLGGAAQAFEVLTPAACYHLYPTLTNTALGGPRHLGVAASCFRREALHQPLARQWAFHMREVVCLGTAAEVQAFLRVARARMTALAETLGLAVRWCAATDPFFEPRAARKRLLQQIAPLKHELVFGDGLAIGSLNFHQAHFGEAFGITTPEGPAFSGCAAFGLERWVAALFATHGDDDERWPL
jgi:seryl-tRNA synthetase